MRTFCTTMMAMGLLLLCFRTIRKYLLFIISEILLKVIGKLIMVWVKASTQSRNIMKYSFLFIVFTMCFFPQYVYSQEQSPPHLTTEMVQENGLLVLSGSEHWKYYPGDNLQWADPDYDDSGWYAISPVGLAIEEMPDSLWDGYGWWRYTFTADSSFYEENWNLYFYGWGAAEVYIDGKLAHSYGNFSVEPNSEVTYSPIGNIHRAVKIWPSETHTVAIRYSHHSAKKIADIFADQAGNLGFGLGFAKLTFNESVTKRNNSMLFISAFSGAVLIILLLLHVTLYIKFRDDSANLYVALFLVFWLISNISVFGPSYFELNNLEYLLGISFWAFSSWVAILLMPYVVSLMFRLKSFAKVKHLVWLSIITTATFFYFFEAHTIITLFLSVLVIGLIIWILVHARKAGKFGVTYVATGSIVLISSVIAYVANGMNLIQLGQFGMMPFDLTIILIYTAFPFGLTLYIANRYGYLYGTMEKEVHKRTTKLEQAYTNLQQSHKELKAAQAQLVQQEKLASLGQLTAGIAHEIKNPLNFVNNFSELSVELIDEARKEVRRGMDERGSKNSLRQPAKSVEAERRQGLSNEYPHFILDILDDIEANLKKIYEHGSRADSIVKSMLQHSRGGSRKMEPTDLNALVKEYVNLSFHGMRAGKLPINVEIEIELDENVCEFPVIAEDFSRVIVNLCSNAFDAMREKTTGDGGLDTGEKYVPKLMVRTHQEDNTVSIEIEDNGPGIPKEMKNKILQPFFTTKKGTAGTGLGLSITNDIIKAHGGVLKIHSKEEGTIMTVILKQS